MSHYDEGTLQLVLSSLTTQIQESKDALAALRREEDRLLATNLQLKEQLEYLKNAHAALHAEHERLTTVQANQQWEKPIWVTLEYDNVLDTKNSTDVTREIGVMIHGRVYVYRDNYDEGVDVTNHVLVRPLTASEMVEGDVAEAPQEVILARHCRTPGIDYEAVADYLRRREQRSEALQRLREAEDALHRAQDDHAQRTMELQELNVSHSVSADSTPTKPKKRVRRVDSRQR